MAKTHFAASLWHIRFDGRDVKALCKDIVKRAQLVYVWDSVPVGDRLENLSSLSNCEDCIAALRTAKVIYLYSCIPAPTSSDEDKTK